MAYRIRTYAQAFWFLPAVFVLAAILGAQATLSIDRLWHAQILDTVPSALRLGVDGSRGLLTAIGGSMLAVAGTTFSITISVIATASSTYGPRLVRNFMTDRGNQVVLGMFVSTFVYCLIVLRAVNSADSNTGQAAFVPYVSTYLALLLALLDVAALVYFLHHISQSIQVTYLIRRVRNELENAVERLYGPDPDPRAVAVEDPLAPFSSEHRVVRAPSDGFLTRVDVQGLLALAQEADAVVALVVIPGDHVLEGDTVALTTADEETALSLAGGLSIGEARTAEQDVGFAVQQLIEVAVRALSSGTNDPYTARTVLAEVSGAMCHLVEHPDALTGRTDEEGRLRLVLRLPEVVDLVDDALNDIRTHGATDPAVVSAALDLMGRMHRVATPRLAARVRMHVDLLTEAFTAGGPPAYDEDRIRDHARAVLGPAPTPLELLRS